MKYLKQRNMIYCFDKIGEFKMNTVLIQYSKNLKREKKSLENFCFYRTMTKTSSFHNEDTGLYIAYYFFQLNGGTA